MRNWLRRLRELLFWWSESRRQPPRSTVEWFCVYCAAPEFDRHEPWCPRWEPS